MESSAAPVKTQTAGTARKGRLDFVRRLPGIRARYANLELLGRVDRRLRRLEAELGETEKRLTRRLRRVPLRDGAFWEAAVAASAGRRTMLNEDRLWILWQAARNAAPLELPVVEVGSYRGGSAYFLARAIVERVGHELPFEVVDTFAGHPGAKVTEHDSQAHAAGTFADVSAADVRSYLSATFALVRVHEGEFSTVAPALPHEQYGLVHLDMDLYLPTIEALRFFAPRVPPGGVVVLDDYEARLCPGIRSAAEEFLAEHPEFQAWNPHTEQLVLVRTATSGPA